MPVTSYWGECMINKKGILIVDDSELDRSILADILQEKYKVFTAANGRDALAVLHENGDHIAVILLDLYMPVMNGYELKKVGKGALTGINRKCVIKVPKKKLKSYKSLFKGKGQKKSVKIK